MVVKAVIPFAGTVTMSIGETKEITDKGVAESLLSAGYVVEVKSTTKKKKGDE